MNPSLILRNGRSQLAVDPYDMWFLDFPLLMNPFEPEATEFPAASTIGDVYQHIAAKQHMGWLTKPKFMKHMPIELSKPGRKFFVRVSGSDLGLCDKVTREEVVAQAQKFGLRQCPTDAPLFTFMQTHDLVSVGGELGQTLYFPARVFLDWESDEKKMWGMQRPLDFILLVWFDAEWKEQARKKWAFEVPAHMIEPEKFPWPHNLRPFTESSKPDLVEAR